MKIVFFGNSKYSVIGAEKIHKKFPISLIVTKPANPVELFAQKNNIPLLTTSKLTDEVVEKIASYQPEFLVVEDYGIILPKKLLSIPKYAPLNIHHSLLPKYRGPTPAPSAILNGEKISGVSVIKMTEKVDAGDIYAQKEYVLDPNETTDSLLTELNIIGGDIIIPVLKKYASIKSKKQNEQDSTYTKYMKKSDGFIDLLNPPNKQKLDLMIRAYYPWPGVWIRLSLGSSGQAQEKIIKFLPEGKIQVEGKNPMPYKDFINGYKEGKDLLSQLKILN